MEQGQGMSIDKMTHLNTSKRGKWPTDWDPYR